MYKSFQRAKKREKRYQKAASCKKVRENISKRQVKWKVPAKAKLKIILLFQLYNKKAAQESDEDAEIRQRSVKERLSPQHKLKNLKANFAEANIWPFLVEQSFQADRNTN